MITKLNSTSQSVRERSTLWPELRLTFQVQLEETHQKKKMHLKARPKRTRLTKTEAMSIQVLMKKERAAQKSYQTILMTMLLHLRKDPAPNSLKKVSLSPPRQPRKSKRKS